jgi:hypothetical protein
MLSYKKIKKFLGMHLLRGIGICSVPKGKIYGIAFDNSNSWMSFSHITFGHLRMMFLEPFKNSIDLH